MANTKPPGPLHPAVARYKKGLEDRAKAAGDAKRATEPKVPNLMAAANQYNPQQDGPMTLGQVAQAQANQEAVVAGEADPKKKLSDATIAGLAALKQEVDNSQPTPQAAPAAPVSPAKVEQVERPEPISIDSNDGGVMADALSDLDVELMLRRMREDVIQNKAQEEALEKRLKPIDFAEGIMTGEFKQVIPIRDGLTIVMRTLTPLENEEIRKIILEMQLQDNRETGLAAERLSFMQTVAAVFSINGEEFPSHVSRAGGETRFNQEVFLKKYSLFSNYPSPFIHTLTTHAYWFDRRVRRLFTVDVAKN